MYRDFQGMYSQPIPRVEENQPKQLNMFRQVNPIQDVQSQYQKKIGVDQFLKENDEIQINQQQFTQSEENEIDYHPHYEHEQSDHSSNTSRTSELSQSSYTSEDQNDHHDNYKQEFFNPTKQFSNFVNKQADIVPNYNTGTFEDRSSQNSKRQYSAKSDRDQEEIQALEKKYAHYMKDDNDSDDETSQYSQQFLNKNENASYSSKSSATYSKASSHTSENEDEDENDLHSDSYSSQTSPMQSVNEYAQQVNRNNVPNQLKYSYSDIEDSEHEDYQNDFLKSSNFEYNAPKMQVFNYQPMFKPTEQQPSYQPGIKIKSDLMSFKSRSESETQQTNVEGSQELITFEFKKPSIADSYRQHRVNTNSKENINSNIQAPKAVPKVNENGEKLYAGGRTKEDILRQRKEMMKPKTKPKEIEEANEFKPKSNSKMDRLRAGERAKVDKKDMLKMTKKNYDELPEVTLKSMFIILFIYEFELS